MVWLLSYKPILIKVKIGDSAGKIMVTVFWNAKGILSIRYMPKGTTINADSYCEILNDLGEVIYRLQRQLPGEKLFLFHNNTHLHTAQKKLDVLKRYKWTISEHPPYSSDLAPSGVFFLFSAFQR